MAIEPNHPFRSRSLTISKVLFCAALVAAAPGIVSPAAAQDGGYRVRAEYKLHGAGAVDALWLDASSRRLYVARTDHVDVLNADTGRREGSMAAQDPAAVVVAAGTGRGFFADRGGNSVAMFDPASIAVLKTIPLDAKGPASLIFDPEAGKVFVIAPGSGDVIALDARSGDVSGKVALPGHLRQAVTDGMGHLFIAAEDLNLIHDVDTHSLKLLGDFPSGDAKGPVSLAIDPSGRRLFVACSDGKLAVIDTDIGFTFEELPIASGNSASVFTFLPQGKGGWKGADFVAGDTGTLTLIQMNAFARYSVGGSLAIPAGVHSLVYDPQTHWIFLPQSAPAPQVLVMTPPSAKVTQ